MGLDHKSENQYKSFSIFSNFLDLLDSAGGVKEKTESHGTTPNLSLRALII